MLLFMLRFIAETVYGNEDTKNKVWEASFLKDDLGVSV